MRYVYILVFLVFLSVFNVVNAQEDEFFEPKTTLGGYGELHYNYAKDKGMDATKKLDFHRFVIFFSHAWSEKWSFKSELEIEHNLIVGGKKSGEVELEQAYVNYHHSDLFGFRAGVVLPSAGFLNEYHEPPLFLSVERPSYAKYIIPTTWFGNGAAIYGQYNNFNYKLTVMEGFNGAGIKAGGTIRGGRVKGYKANAEELLYNAAVNYTGFSGLVVGSSFSTNKAVVNADTSIGVSLFELHAKYEANNVIVVAEYGNISYTDNNAGFTIENAMGYYVDFGYNISSLLNCKGQVIPWFRYSDYNTAAKVKGGGSAEKANHHTKWLVGLTIKPINEVVFKFEYGQDKAELKDDPKTLINLGVGYMF